MICSSEKRFFTSNLRLVGDWTPNRRATQNRGDVAWAGIEPRISANLSNQFEWPLFFHVACLALLQLPHSTAAVAFAWLFVAGRVLHSVVQIGTRSVRLRGVVFTVNFLAVLALWAQVLMAAVSSGA
jgi:hypothetical protein